MNFAKLNNSDRLLRVAQFLSDGLAHSTLEIVEKAHVCAVNSIIAELRANGMEIDCERKGPRWYYRMLPNTARMAA